MKHIQLLSLFLVFVFLYSEKSPSQTKTLSLNEAISLAMQKNTSMITSRNAVESQESFQRVAYGALFPSLNASGSWNRSQNNPADPGPLASNRVSAGLDASITFFDGFSNFAALERAQLNVKTSELSRERTEQQTIYQTISLYLNVLRTEELLNVRKDNLNRSNQQLKRIQESQKLGGVAMADVFRQQVIVSNDELALIQAQNDYDKTKLDLITYLTLDPLSEYVFQDNTVPKDIDSTEVQNAKQQEQNLTMISSQAMQNRFDFVTAQQSVTGAELNVRYYKGDWWPSLRASASLDYGGPEFGTTTYGGMSWGISASYPIFNNFQRENSIQQAAIDLRNANEALGLKERQVKTEIKKALLDLEAASKSIEVSQTGVRSAIEDRRIAEEKYNLGAGTLLDKLVADANYTSAISNKVNSVYNYILAKKNLEFVLGTLK
ncbi:MAG: TolC family protein [Ignavibacteriales bacterium]|nr:TolC family protein [Ignavibacteriales bacterium]